MKPLPRGWLSFCLATSCLLAAVQPAPAQNPGTGLGSGTNIGNPPGGLNVGNPPDGLNVGNPPGGLNAGNPNVGMPPGGMPMGGTRPLENSAGLFPNTTNNSGNGGAVYRESNVGGGTIVAGIGMILVGLALTSGVVYLALQGQKSSYAGGSSRRPRKKRRNADD